jgi:hypothetical protein
MRPELPALLDLRRDPQTGGAGFHAPWHYPAETRVHPEYWINHIPTEFARFALDAQQAAGTYGTSKYGHCQICCIRRTAPSNQDGQK